MGETENLDPLFTKSRTLVLKPKIVHSTAMPSEYDDPVVITARLATAPPKRIEVFSFPLWDRTAHIHTQPEPKLSVSMFDISPYTAIFISHYTRTKSISYFLKLHFHI
jgi:hypothetical protein